jgi:acyl-CoA synthetase (AMP-forming)/AMP-acid ligase II
VTAFVETFVFIDALPRSPTGNVQRRALKDREVVA